jgi:hypothetical protein
MAYEVLHAVAVRLEREGRLQGPLAGGFTIPGASDLVTSSTDHVERPALTSLRAAA